MNQQNHRYYEYYKKSEVSFTKEVNESLGLITHQIHLKCKSKKIPCLVYSSSLEGAQVVVSLTENLSQFLHEKAHVSLRLCFTKGHKGGMVSFFIQSQITEQIEQEKNRNWRFFHLKFTQKPPDDYIEILGNLIETNINAKRRAEERILVDAVSIRHLGLSPDNIVVASIEGTRLKSILRDLSFNGAKIILFGKTDDLIDKEVSLDILLANGKSLSLLGKIIRIEDVEGQKELVALAIKYNPEKTNFQYNLLINNFLKKTKFHPSSRRRKS